MKTRGINSTLHSANVMLAIMHIRLENLSPETTDETIKVLGVHLLMKVGVRALEFCKGKKLEVK